MPSKQLRRALRSMTEGGAVDINLTILDQNKKGVAGIECYLMGSQNWFGLDWAERRKKASKSTTNASGVAKFKDMKTGNYVVGPDPVSLSKQGYALAPGESGTRTVDIELTSSAKSRTIDVVSIAATFGDLKIQLLQLGTNTGISGAKIALNGSTKNTDSSGLATFSNLDPKKSYVPTITKSGYDLKTAVPPIGIPPRADPYTFYMAPSAHAPTAPPSVGDIKVFVKDPSGMGISKIPITMIGTGQTQQTDTSGAATFRNVRTDANYDLNVALPAGASLVSMPPYVNVAGSPYTITASAPAAPAVAPKEVLNVQVTEPTGTPVSGATVHILLGDKPTGTRGTTDPSGKASIGPMYIQPYKVKVIKSGYATAEALLTPNKTAVYPIIMTKGMSSEPLPTVFLIKDRITGMGIPGVRIFMSPYPSVATDQSGKATIMAAPGSYSFDVDTTMIPSNLGRFKGLYGLSVNAGETYTVNLAKYDAPSIPSAAQVERLYSATGKIIDSQTPGAPIDFSGATMVIKGGATDASGKAADRLVAMFGPGGGRWGPIGADGSFTALYEKKGSYSVEVRVSRYKWSTHSLNFTEAPTPTTIQITKVPTEAATSPVTKVEKLDFGCLSGKITNKQGKPITAATVTAGGLTAATDTQGNYSIPKIKSGSTPVMITKAGYKPYNTTVNIKATMSATSTPGIDSAPPLPTAAPSIGVAQPAIGSQASSAMAFGRQPMSVRGSPMTAPSAQASPATRASAGTARTTLPQCNILNVTLDKMAKTPDEEGPPDITPPPDQEPPPYTPPYTPPDNYYQPPAQAPPTQIDVSVGAPSVEVPVSVTAPSTPAPSQGQPGGIQLPALPDPVEFLLAPLRAFQKGLQEFQPPR